MIQQHSSTSLRTQTVLCSVGIHMEVFLALGNVFLFFPLLVLLIMGSGEEGATTSTSIVVKALGLCLGTFWATLESHVRKVF